MKTEKKRVTEDDVLAALERRYGAPFYCFFPHFRDATGFQASRTADGLAMSLYKSRGLAIMGFEVKVSRGDWLSELKQPEKAEAVLEYCDSWWIVTPKDVIQPGEVPKSWGWLEFKGGKLFGRKEAEQLTPKPISRFFLASMIQRAAKLEASSNVVSRDLAHKWVVDARVEGRKGAEDQVKTAERKVEQLREALRKFEEVSGIRINEWSQGDSAAAVAMVMKLDRLKLAKDASWVIDRIKEEVRDLEKGLTDLDLEIKARRKSPETPT